jgi:DUF971 family protein
MNAATAPAAPAAIHNTAGELVLHWSDGATSRLNHHTLRAACPCAQCRASRLRGEIRLVDAGVKVVAINPMGYGVQLVFDDGHDRGIFPWRFLREITAR